jgi:UTP-glucose-1-phosphate uridylyltransferase
MYMLEFTSHYEVANERQKYVSSSVGMGYHSLPEVKSMPQEQLPIRLTVRCQYNARVTNELMRD